jgi:protein-serine/threonine kinase
MTTLAYPTQVDLASDDEWMPWPGGRPPLHSRSTSITSYGVTVIGRGNRGDERASEEPEDYHGRVQGGGSASTTNPEASSVPRSFDSDRLHRPTPSRPPSSFLSVSRRNSTMMAPPPPSRPSVLTGFGGPLTQSPTPSPVISRPASPSLSRTPLLNGYNRSPQISRPGTPSRSRRRSSQQRVSLIAGRLALLPNEPPAKPDAPQRLVRSGSTRSFLSVAASVGPPTPSGEEDFSLGKSLSEYVSVRARQARTRDG